jgi:hypothetical protein
MGVTEERPLRLGPVSSREGVIMAHQPVTPVPYWHAGPLLLVLPARHCYHIPMPRKKKKSLRRRIRKKMPPPEKVIEDKSKYDRKREKEELQREESDRKLKGKGKGQGVRARGKGKG